VSRMFKTVTKTWNPYTGCHFNCDYCWARDLAEGKLSRLDKYRRNGFAPAFHEGEFSRRVLRQKLRPGGLVFVSDMGDLAWAKPGWRQRIAEVIAGHPETNFLLQSKDPSTFRAWPDLQNVYWGTTIESNRPYAVTKAPFPATRYLELWSLTRQHKFVSIEPIMDFDLKVLLRWIGDIKPEIVEIGADNHGHNLPEPPWEKVERLLHCLRQICPTVVEKEGLDRLKG